MGSCMNKAVHLSHLEIKGKLRIRIRLRFPATCKQKDSCLNMAVHPSHLRINTMKAVQLSQLTLKECMVV